ncbi:MAG: DUF4931 domain-containing protein [Planctomycetes bacterium]|nr:DUF4931 domain-containing protein [Planctomycetota bacterium]
MNPDPREQPRTVVDPTTGRPILMAPLRQKRPMHTGQRKVDAACPFCSGNEAATPPAVDTERDDDVQDDVPGWIARAFPNLYPANLHHEVIAEGAEHKEHPSELDAATWARCVALWQRRVRAMEARPGVACAFLFKNVGAFAGASIAHNHSQVLGLDALPPRVELEREMQRRAGRCLWCATLHTAEDEQRLVWRDAGFAIVAPEPPKLPNETWLLPTRCDSDFLAAEPDALGAALARWFGAIGTALDQPPCNFWLHQVPATLRGAETFHWHFELQPRTGQLAGLELGGDMYINSVPATRTAERLRAALTDR